MYRTHEMTGKDRYSTLRRKLFTVMHKQAYKETWAKMFKPPFEIAIILYLHAYAELDDDVQDIHLYEIDKLLEEDRSTEVAWWVWATIQSTTESELCRRSLTEKTGFS